MELKIGSLIKKSKHWYRIPISYGEYKYGSALANSVVDIIYHTEYKEWVVIWSEELGNDWLTWVDYPTYDDRYNFSKLLAAKSFALDWANHLLNNSFPDPTDYNVDDDKYIDLDVFGRKSKYYKAGMFK